MRITDDTLVDLAGPGAYDRGCDYYREGCVGDIEVKDNRIVARVIGTNLYRVELLYDGAGLDGSCDCPASDGIEFCKHCVATALEFRDQLTESALTTTGGGNETFLRAYLAEQDREALFSYLLQVLPKDPQLYQRLQQQAMLAANAVDVKDLKQSITKVTPMQNIFEWGKVSEYFSRIEATVNEILENADQLAADIVLETALHGMRRINIALERVDDSGGYRYEAQALLRELHCVALKRIDWTPERRAEHLFEQALADPWDQFEGAPMDYAEALGDAGLSAFYAIVESRFAALPTPSKSASFEDRVPFLRLREFLMVRAREQENFDEMLRLEKLTAATAVDFDSIARLYLKKGEPETAIRWLSKADALDKHDLSPRKALWAAVHTAMGDWDAAIAAQDAAFRRDCSYDIYKELIGLARKAGRTAECRKSVFEFLRSENPALAPSDERRAQTLIQILIDDQDLAAVKETALARINDSQKLLQAARWIAELSAADAAPVYEKAIDALVKRKTNRCYRWAVKALLEARPVLDATGSLAFDECVSRLRATHFRKRNFLAVLDQRIGAA